VDSAGKVSKSTSVAGDLTSIVAGTGLSGTSLTGPIPTLNVDASQTQVTAVGVIATGQWRGTDIGVAYGGTGLSTVGTNEILTGNGVGALTSESTLIYTPNTLTIGDTDGGLVTIIPPAHDNGNGAALIIEAGPATAGQSDKTGGTLAFYAGQGTGTGSGGIRFYVHPAAGGTASTLNSELKAMTVANDGTVKIDSGTLSGPTDGHLSILSDRSMVFVIDDDNDETSQIFSFMNGAVEIARLGESGDLQIDGDLTVSGNDIKDSGGNSIISSDGSGVVTMAGGNIGFGTSGGSDNSNFNINSGCDIVLGADVAGGTSSTIMYLDSGPGAADPTNRYMLMAEATDKVVLCNRAANGTVQIRANTSTAGGGGEVTVATFADDKVTISQDLDVAGTIRPGITYIKILPSDFIADDGGRPLAIDDTSSDRFLESHGTNPMFASVEIPAGFKATHVDIYGNGTSAVTVYEATIEGRTVTSKGTGNIGTQIDITDVTSDATNYLLIQLVQTSGEQVNGGKVTIAAV
tara:strand:- start:1790 stop:3349 length:1560 start_codon:yes stop_codon:yes gene_type:complete